MKRDLVYILQDGEILLPYGNLKTLLESIKSADKYSTVWRLLENGGGFAVWGAYSITKSEVIRAPYTGR